MVTINNDNSVTNTPGNTPPPQSGTGATPTSSPGTPISGINIGYGSSSFPMYDPGMMNPASLNPYAAGYLNNNQSLMSQVQGSMLNPQQYQQLQGTQQQNLTTSLNNQYAAMGLSGSSAEMGGVAQAINQNQMSWLNRQQSDAQKYAGTMTGLNQQGYGDLMGIQSQYGQFQDVYGQDIVGLEGLNQQQDAGNNQMWGQIAGGALAAGGTIAGGYAGGGDTNNFYGGGYGSSSYDPALGSYFGGSNPYSNGLPSYTGTSSGGT